jgi:lysophospholipase L1-like esterase
MDEAAAGDYVFIQFGHNDEVKSKVNSYTTPEEFSANLKKYIVDAREKKMNPVLMTPVARRKFDATGKIEQTHQEYSALVRKVATEEKLLFIDLDTPSMQLYQQFGVEQSKLLFCQLKPGEHPNYPDGKEDNTHFNELGARLIAQLVLKEIRSTIPDLIPYITSKNP